MKQNGGEESSSFFFHSVDKDRASEPSEKECLEMGLRSLRRRRQVMSLENALESQLNLTSTEHLQNEIPNTELILRT